MIAEPVEMNAEVKVNRHKFKVDDYLRIVELGVMGEDTRVELIWGELVEMSPINIAHTSTNKRLISLLTSQLGKRIVLGVQDPVQIGEDSLPLPDISVLKPRVDFYSERQPGPDDILFFIEVADSSLRFDQRVKAKLYGAASIADYWIINLPERQIEVYREPQPDGYRTVTRYKPGESISPLAFPDASLNVDDIIGDK